MTKRLSDERLEALLSEAELLAPNVALGIWRIHVTELLALLREAQEARRVEAVLCSDCAQEAGVHCSACESCGAELA